MSLIRNCMFCKQNFELKQHLLQHIFEKHNDDSFIKSYRFNSLIEFNIWKQLIDLELYGRKFQFIDEEADWNERVFTYRCIPVLNCESIAHDLICCSEIIMFFDRYFKNIIIYHSFKHEHPKTSCLPSEKKLTNNELNEVCIIESGNDKLVPPSPFTTLSTAAFPLVTVPVVVTAAPFTALVPINPVPINPFPNNPFPINPFPINPFPINPFPSSPFPKPKPKTLPFLSNVFPNSPLPLPKTPFPKPENRLGPKPPTASPRPKAEPEAFKI
ncbi:hypothetical protein BLOT_013026 [Blomia tropicalis]|nr:hypothetical protein BLOT_013026 [Blomia tropicalis]